MGKLLKQGMLIFILIIFISSSLAFIYSPSNGDPSESSFDYNGYTFNYEGQRFVTSINDIDFYFDFSPQGVSFIEIPEIPFFQEKVYLLFDAEDKDSTIDYTLDKMAYVLQSFGINTVKACISEEGCSELFPVKDCVNGAVYVKKANESLIHVENDCLVLEGNDAQLIQNADRINYELLGVI